MPKDEGPMEKDTNNNTGYSNMEEKKPITVVLKVDFHCLGCIDRLKKAIRSFNGVEMVREGGADKLTVFGVGIDPVKLRESVEKKTKKKVELVSPQPKKEKSNGGGGNMHGDAGDGGNKKAAVADHHQEKPDGDNKKANKEPPVTTAVLKVAYHCHGCGLKIHKAVSNYKGVYTVEMDKERDLVTVKGTMDTKALVDWLKGKLRKPVEIVPPEKKDKSNVGGGGGGKKKKGSEKDGGGNMAGKNEMPGGNSNSNANRMEYYVTGSGYECRDASSGNVVVDVLHAPQWFSEENANGCSIM